MIRKELKLLKKFKHQIHCHKAKNDTEALTIYTACYQHTTQIIDNLLEMYTTKLNNVLKVMDKSSVEYHTMKAVDSVLYEDTIHWYQKIMGKVK